MEDFSKWAALIGGAFSPVLRWIVMKRDCELPWVTRMLRWAFAILGVLYATGFVAKSYMEWFG